MPKVKVPWLCSRSQLGIKVFIRDLRGHLLHTVTFLVFFSFLYLQMSQSKIKKYIDRPLHFNGRLRSKPVILSDSKGFSLKPHLDLVEHFQENIIIECRAGARFQDYFHWLRIDLITLDQSFGNIVLYIFLGTCDFTFKKGKFTELRHKDDISAISYVKFQIERYLAFVKKIPQLPLSSLKFPHIPLKHGIEPRDIGIQKIFSHRILFF